MWVFVEIYLKDFQTNLLEKDFLFISLLLDSWGFIGYCQVRVLKHCPKLYECHINNENIAILQL